MPELPEVETIRRGLAARILGKRIALVEVTKPKMVRGNGRDFVEVLTGALVVDITRRAKLLSFELDESRGYVLTHLKMTGQLIYEEGRNLVGGGHPFPTVAQGLPSKYSHIIWKFEDGSVLYFNDMRQFGFMALVDEAGREAALARYGPEPLTDDFLFDDFYSKLKRRSVALKVVLLDQSVVAGLGNIYVDEVCFAAKVAPGRSAKSLTRREARAVFEAIPIILELAIAFGGTTFRNFRDDSGAKGNFSSQLKVYGRGGQGCVQCGETLRKVKIGQRGTVYCMVCQK